MVPYYLLLGFIVLLGAAATGLSDPLRRRVVVTLSFIVIGGMVGLRAVSVGTDTLSYSFLYRTEYRRQDELGYTIFSAVAHGFGLSFQVFLLIIAVIVTGSIAFAIYLHSDVPWQSFYLHICLGLFAMSMTGLRQSLAVALTVIGVLLLIRGRRLGFISFILLAYTFHNSAIALLPLVLLHHVRLTRRSALVVLVLAVVIASQGAVVADVTGWLGWSKYDYYFQSTTQINPMVIAVSAIVPLGVLALWPVHADGMGSARIRPAEGPACLAHGKPRTTNLEMGGPSKRGVATFGRAQVQTVGSAARVQGRRGSPEGTHRAAHAFSVLYVLSVLNLACVVLARDLPILTRLTYYFLPFIAIVIPNGIARFPDLRLKMFANVVVVVLPLALFAYTMPQSSLGINPFRFAW